MMKRQPTHPGEILREDILPELKISKAQFARDIHISRQTFYDILNCESPVTVETAVKLAKYLGNEPLFWVNLQSQYDLWKAVHSMQDELDDIHVLTA